MAKIFVNTCTTGYLFINKKFAEKVYQVLKIKPQCLINLK